MAKHILIADDDELLAELIEFKLQVAGYHVQRVCDGESALEAIEQQTPHALLLDVMLPGIDGFEVLRTIKSNADTASIPVMMLTGRKLETDVVSGLNLGADEYVVKPFMVEELLVRLRRLLERSARGRS